MRLNDLKNARKRKKAVGGPNRESDWGGKSREGFEF